MLFIILFLAEILSLFYFSRLVTASLSKIFYKLTKDRDATIFCLAILFLPGTIIHELAHVLVAGVLLVSTGEVNFFPEIEGDGVRLGSAEIGKTDPFRRAFIGLAPVVLGLTLIFWIIIFFINQIKLGSTIPFWVIIALIYSIFEISNTMFSSKKDLEGISIFLILIISFLTGLYLIGIFNPFEFLQILIETGGNFFKMASLILLTPILINLALLGLSKTFPIDKL